MKKLFHIFTLLIVAIFCFAGYLQDSQKGVISQRRAGAAWYDDWNRKVEITVPKATVCANGTLTDFPILLRVNGATSAYDGIPSEAIDAGSNSAQDGGGDLRFYDNTSTDYSQVGVNPTTEDTNRLAAQVVNFVASSTASSQVAQVWVKVPSVNCNDQGGDSTTIVMYYDSTSRTQTQPGASESFGSQATWKSAFKAVYHMEEASGNLTDSTSNALTLTANGSPSYETAGKIGNSITFTSAGGAFFETNTAAFTAAPGSMTAWANPDDAANVYGLVFVGYYGDGNNYFVLALDGSSDDHANASTRDSVGTSTADSTTTFTATWLHAAAIFDITTGTDRTACLNGGNCGTETTDRSPTTPDRTSVGHLGDSTPGYILNGEIDEVHIFNTNMPTNWIEAEYNNHGNPATNSSEGTPSGL